MNRAPLVFLKLGGALLTHKDQSASPRSAELRRLVGEIAPAWRERSIRLVLGHGSGSFAHVAAQRSGFLERPDDPLAFAQVAAAARDLSALVVRALLDEDLPALMLPGGLLAAGEDGAAVDLRTELVAGALARGLLPVTYGDAAPRRGLGGGIVSTEPLLAALALALRPARLRSNERRPAPSPASSPPTGRRSRRDSARRGPAWWTSPAAWPARCGRCWTSPQPCPNWRSASSPVCVRERWPPPSSATRRPAAR